jgi:hypothetical protein
MYSHRSIILIANTDISRYVLVINTFILAKSIMSQREYQCCKQCKFQDVTNSHEVSVMASNRNKFCDHLWSFYIDCPGKVVDVVEG